MYRFFGEDYGCFQGWRISLEEAMTSRGVSDTGIL